MIFEMRTYRLQPGSVPEVEKRFGEAYEKRKKYSELAAFWHTEVGSLNPAATSGIRARISSHFIATSPSLFRQCRSKSKLKFD